MTEYQNIKASLVNLLKSFGLDIHIIDRDRHYWFIRTQAGSYFDEFFLDGFVGIGHEDVPCVPENARTQQIIEQVKATHTQATRVLNQVYKFCHEIKKGDIVIIPSASSAKFAFGYITDDDIYTENVSDEDIDEGKCPFTRRRKTEWITGISKSRVDSKLYTFFRNQQTLSQVDEYSEYIERAIHSFYIKDNIAHFTLSVETPDSPNAFDLPIFMCGILSTLQSLCDDLHIEFNEDSIKSRVNVQSPGLMELLGDPILVMAVGFIVLGICGGKLSCNSQDDSLKFESGGIPDIIKAYSKHKQDMEKIRLKAEKLGIKNPIPLKRRIGFIQPEDLVNNKSLASDEKHDHSTTNNPSANK